MGHLLVRCACATFFKRLARHGLVHGVMPMINYVSRRGYVQYRPDRYVGRFEEITHLQKIWERGRRGNNRGDYVRLYFLVTNIEALEECGVPGAIAELGVYKGSSARIIRHLAPTRDLYLFDTFEGFPEEHTSRDPGVIRPGGYASCLDEVRRFVGDHSGIKYCKGIFLETASMVPPDVSFAMVHLDCDLYVPTKAALEFFYPRMSPGGIIILHDYWSGCWAGVPRAVDEFLADKPEGLVRIPDKSGTAAVVKLSRTGKMFRSRDRSGGFRKISKRKTGRAAHSSRSGPARRLGCASIILGVWPDRHRFFGSVQVDAELHSGKGRFSRARDRPSGSPTP